MTVDEQIYFNLYFSMLEIEQLQGRNYLTAASIKEYLELINETEVEERKRILCYGLAMDRVRQDFLIEERKKYEAIEKARVEREAEQARGVHRPHRG